MVYFTESLKTLFSDDDDLLLNHRNQKLIFPDDDGNFQNINIDDNFPESKNLPIFKKYKIGGSYLINSRKHFDELYKLSNISKLMELSYLK